MIEANAIINQLLLSQSDREREKLEADFDQLAANKKSASVNRLIKLLDDVQTDRITRSWLTTFLGLTKSKAAKLALMGRLPVEKDDLVRRWIAVSLVNHFSGEDRVALIVKQVDQEQTTANRLHMVRVLNGALGPTAISKLTELINDDTEYVRFYAIWGLGEARTPQAVVPLIQRLEIEKSDENCEKIIESLGNIGDPQATSSLIAQLRKQDRKAHFLITTARALGQLTKPENEEAIRVLLRLACHSDLVVSVTATNALVTILSRDEAARRLAEFGLQEGSSDSLTRIADALRLIGGTTAVEYLRNAQGEKAESLLEQIGGRLALNVLLDRRIASLNDAKARVENFDAQAEKILTSTVNDAKLGFTMSLWMSGIIFAIGICLLIVSLYLVVVPSPTQFQQLFGIGGALAGLGTILTMFYRGPLERIERAVTNLVRTEVSFLSYIRQITQITAMFEKEYVDNTGFGVPELKQLLNYIERAMKEAIHSIGSGNSSSSDDSVSYAEKEAKQ